MKSKERRAEAERLAEELRMLSDEARENLGMYVPDYLVVRVKSEQKSFCALLVTFAVMSYMCIFWDWPIGTAIVVPVIAYLVCILRSLIKLRPYDEEIRYRQCDIDDMAERLSEVKMVLEEYEQKVAELEPLIQKFRKLEPIVVDELEGEFDLKTKGEISNFRVRAALLGECRRHEITEQGYADLVRRIIAARKDRKLIQEFEDSVNQ